MNPTTMKMAAPLAVLCGIAMSAEAADLITNGSFELGQFTNQGSDTESLLPGATTITGWTVAGVSGTAIAWIGATNPWGVGGTPLPAQDGGFFLDLTNYKAGAPFGGVTQTVSTVIGQQYDLSFYLGSYTARWGGPPVSITASAGGTSQAFTNSTTTSSPTWTREDLKFTATSSSTAISLVGAAGVNYIGLDNVSLTAVPEPSEFATSLLGLGVFAFVSSRRRRTR